MFNIQVISDVIAALQTPKKSTGTYNYAVQLLTEKFQESNENITKEVFIKLASVKSDIVQDFCGFLLKNNYQHFSKEFTTSEIVNLANHEILTIRQAAQSMFLQKLAYWRTNSQEMLSAVRMLESKWQDSRELAFKIFTTEFHAEELTPEILVSICDSVNENARKLGRDLLTRNFQAASGQEYLLKCNTCGATHRRSSCENLVSPV